MPEHSRRRAAIVAGIRDSLSPGLGVFPLGIGLGLLVLQAGLPWWLTPALSTAVYAGSVELLLVGLIAAAAPIATIALTVFLVNFRHIFYAFSFPLDAIKSKLGRLYAIYALSDEAYAVAASLPEEGRDGPRIIAMQCALQAYWVGGGLVGVTIGAFLPARIEGLDFALCALFTVLTLDALRSRREVPSAVLAAASVAIGLLLDPADALFVGLMLFAVALIIRSLVTRRSTQPEGAIE